jgi:hypothetical protein
MAGFDEVVPVLKRHCDRNRGPLAENPHMWKAAIIALALLVLVVLSVLIR